MKSIFFACGVLCAAACNGGASGPSPDPLPDGMTAIAAIQGTSSASPLEGQSVVVVGIVTGDFQDNDADTVSNLGGFYLQQELSDGNDATSDGIFVFDGDGPSVNVSEGDRVEVRGTVTEFFGETQLAASAVTVIGSGTILATDVALPTDGIASNSNGDNIANLERYEGMLLHFPDALTVTNLRNLEQFGEVGLSAQGRLYQFTNGNAPDESAYSSHREANAARSILLDDGQRTRNPSVVRYLPAAGGSVFPLRAGSTIRALTGNLRYSRGSGGNGDEAWRLMPTVEPAFDDSNPRPGAPEAGGTLRIASFNVLNFFSTIDSGQDTCGPTGNDSCRGADSAEELARQTAKTVSALALMNADIVGLIELENNGSESISALVNALNARIGTAAYAFVDTGTIHDDAIKTGFIYRSSSVRSKGPFALLDASVDARFDDRRNRPALAQSFETVASGATLTLIVNHLKSKGSSCESDGDRNLGDGQGNCNRSRSNAARALADWLSTDPTGSGDPDFLIIGDLNAYSREDPLSALQDAGLISLLDADDNHYSFLFDAQSGALDHALATPGLAAQVVDAIEWHINADEAAVLDYNLENGRNPDLFDADTPYRASDHDPLIIGLELTN